MVANVASVARSGRGLLERRPGRATVLQRLFKMLVVYRTSPTSSPDPSKSQKFANERGFASKCPDHRWIISCTMRKNDICFDVRIEQGVDVNRSAVCVIRQS